MTLNSSINLILA